MNDHAIHPCCLTVAGSDCGGNAGIQADLRAFRAFGVHGCTVISALTAQNPFAVRGVLETPPEFVAAQLDAVLGVYDIRALKTGMLPGAGAVEAVAERLAARPGIRAVVDPVAVATSGARLASSGAAAALREKLLPRAALVTPNLPEARALLGEAPRDGGSAEEARALARRLGDAFGCAALVKGGHGAGAEAVDVLYDPATGETADFARPRVAHPVSTHGTGCALSAAIAAGLARGRGLAEAVAAAKDYVYAAIRTSYPVGPDGCGVLGDPDAF